MRTLFTTTVMSMSQDGFRLCVHKTYLHKVKPIEKGKTNEKYAPHSSENNKNVIDLALLMKFKEAFVYSFIWLN